MFTDAMLCFSLVRSELFYFRYPNNAVSIHADTVILSGLMSCLSDHPQQTTIPQLNPPPSPVSTLLPPSAPIPFPGTCPITVTVIAPAWVIPQCVRAGDTEPAPPRCVLWQQRVSNATADDVRMPPRGGHHPLSLCFSVHYTNSTGCCSAEEKLWQNTRECKGFTGKYTTVCEMINAESQWSQSIKYLVITLIM